MEEGDQERKRKRKRKRERNYGNFIRENGEREKNCERKKESYIRQRK